MAVIARATPRHAPGVARVYVDTWRSAYAGILPENVLLGMSYARQEAEWQRAIRCQAVGQAVIAATEGEHGVVGLVSCGRGRGHDRPGGGPFADDDAAGPPGEVFTLYVQPEFHGRGIGRQLLGAAFQALRDGGCDRALIWVLSLNPSRYFYEATGGRAVAERMSRLWGANLPQTAYGWSDLERVIARLGSCSAR